jgi:hypothetical protein
MDALSHMLKEASKLEKAGAEHGWEVKTTHNVPDMAMPDFDGADTLTVIVVDCVATRGQETVSIWWENKHLVEPPKYVLAGYEVKLRNASACVQQMAKPPNLERAARKTKLRQMAGEETDDLTPDPASLPWKYLDDPTDKEILRACYARTIVWTNSITERAVTDVVVRSINPKLRTGNFNSNNYHITRSSSGRMIINFLGVFGFRSVALDKVLRVGSSQEAADRTTKELLKQAAAEEEDKARKWQKVRKDVV